MRYLASCSFGKDSVATVITAMLHNEPLHELVYCEVMFDDNGTSAEIPEHAAFIHDVAIPEFRGWGIKTNIIRSDKNFLERFNHLVGSGPHTGKCWAWPLCGRCYVQRDLKVRPIQRWKRTLGDDVIQYIGIEADEQERLLRLDGVKHISLLQKYGVTKDKVFDLCTSYGLLSPTYAFTDRGGVLFLSKRQRRGAEAPLPTPPRSVAVVDAVASYTEQDHGTLEPKRNIFRGG